MVFSTEVFQMRFQERFITTQTIQIVIFYIMPILQTHIESQIGDSLEHTMKSIKYNKYVYVHGDTWITQDQKRKIQNAIELKMVS